MTIDTPAGTINQITPIREFVELTTITNAQYLLGIQNMSTGNGSKITFGNLITSLISGNANNKLVKGSDGKLFISTPVEIGTLANLTTTNKTNLVSAINELNSNMGSLSNLETTVKTNLVAAINSVAELTEPELLIDKVNQSKALVTGNVAGYQEELEQLKLMKRSTFDRSKFTVVGSPTIADNGIASGFGKISYTQQSISTNSTIDTTNAQSMRMEYEFKVLEDIQLGGQLFLLNYASKGINGNPNIQLYKGGLFVQAFEKNYSVKTGNRYKVEFDLVTSGISYLRIYEDNVLKLEASRENYTDWKQNNPIFFYGYYSGENYNAVEIYLPSIVITVDGKEVFSGNKTGIDVIKPDNYEVVGCPTISDDGIASGFRELQDTIVVPQNLIDLTKPFRIVSSFKTGSVLTGTNPIFGTNEAWGNFVFYTGNFICVWLIISPSTTITWDLNVKHSILPNTYYKVIFEWTGTTYKLGLVTEDGLYKETRYDNSNPIRTYTSFKIGSMQHYACSCDEIDLNSFKVYNYNQLTYQPCLKIPYYESSVQYGSKVVDVQYRDRVLDAYQQGYKNYKYYTLDEINGNFTLPHGEIYGMLEQVRTENEQNNEAVRQIVDVKDNLYKILEGHQSTNKTLWDLITFTDNSEADNLLIGGDSPFTSNSSNSNFHFYLLNSIIGTNQPDDTAKLNVYKLFNKSHHDAQSDPIYVQDGTIVIACAKPTKLSKILLRSYDTYYTTPSIVHIHGANITNNMSRDITMTDFTSYAKYIGGISTTKEDTYTTPTNTNWGINRPIELTIDDKDTFNTFFISMSHWCSGQNDWNRRLVGVQVYGTQMTNDDSNYTVKMSGDYENCKWIASNGKIYNTDDLYQQYGYIPKEKVQLSRWISCFGSGIGQTNATTRAADQYYPKYISGSISTTKNNGGQPWYFLRQTNYSAEPRPQVGYNISNVGYLDISSTLNNQTVIDYTADSSFPIGEYYWEGTFGYNQSPTAHGGNTYMCGWCQLQKVYDDGSVEIIQTFSKEGSMYEPSVCYRTPRFYANRAFKKLRLIIKEMAFPNAAMILSQMQLYYRDNAGNIARSFIPNATQYDLSYNTVKHKSNIHFFITPTGVRVGSNCFIEKTDPTTKAACVGNRWINENTKKSYVCNTSGVWTEEDFCEIGCMTMFGSKHKGMRLRTVANSENPMQKYIQDQGDMGGNLALDYSLAVNASTVVTSSPTDPDFYFQAESKDENEGVEFSLPANTKTLQSYRRSLVKSKVYQGGQQFAHWSNCDHTGAILKAYKTFDTSAAGEYIEGSEAELQ